MGKKKKAQAKSKSVPKPLSKLENPASAEVLGRIGELERRILAEFAEQRKVSERGRVGMVAFSRTVNTLLLPLRVVLWAFGCVLHPVASAKILRDWFFIRKSGMFDVAFYLREYPDVMASAVNPRLHYCMTGWREMRNPRPDFVTAAYLERNPDIKLCGMNPFYHYVRYRGAEPHREGTGCPMTGGSSVRMNPASLSPSHELKKVPAPLIEKSLNAEILADIAVRVKRGLYEGA